MDRVFKLTVGLQLPPGSKGKFLPAGTAATESELEGLAVEPLLASGFLVEGEQQMRCPACQADEAATKKAKDAKYDSLLDLREHYMKDHPALAAPATIQEV